MFISKSFISAQLRWSVSEKEGYAIVYCFIKMEHLLKDRHFDRCSNTRTLKDEKTRNLRNNLIKLQSDWITQQRYNWGDMTPI